MSLTQTQNQQRSAHSEAWAEGPGKGAVMDLTLNNDASAPHVLLPKAASWMSSASPTQQGSALSVPLCSHP